MSRHFVGSLIAALLLAVPAAAQPRAGMFGGFRGPGPRPFADGARPAGNGYRMVQGVTFDPRNGAPTGGFFPTYAYGAYGGYPYTSFYGGGGFIAGGYSPYYVLPGPPVVLDAPTLLPPQNVPPAPVVELSGQFPATLVLEFPAPAKVWLDGKEVAGDAAAVRTLTSPVLRPGEQYTFRVRAEWEANGQRYTSSRDVPLGPGDRSRLLVVSGTAVAGEK